MTSGWTPSRARLEAGAEAGRTRRAERSALVAELDEVQAGLARLGPRLPTVRAHTLQLRLDGYRQALDALPPGRSARVSRPGQEAGLMAGTAALGWAVLQAAPAAPVTAGAGLVAAGGVATVMTVRNRLRRKERRTAVTKALTAALRDAALAEYPVADLSRMLRELVKRARGSGRLTVGASALLVRIAERLDALLARSLSDSTRRWCTWCGPASPTTCRTPWTRSWRWTTRWSRSESGPRPTR